MDTLNLITIDGPAGVGKSTLSKLLAARLHLPYLDTGAMFRSLALQLGKEASTLDEDTLRTRCAQCRFDLKPNAEGQWQLLCNDAPVGDAIRTEEVGMMAAQVASLPVVRQALKAAQQSIGAHTALVAEGRDMGTEVFPTARYKFFLDASPAVRAQRRFNELEARKAPHPSLEELTAQIRQRDDMDRNRPIAPLRPAQDAIIIDTSELAIEQVLEKILGHIADAGGLPAPQTTLC